MLASLVLSSCASPQAIATFADNSGKILAQGPSLFRDIQASCIRRHLDAQPVSALYVSTATAPEPAACVPFGPQGDALVKASEVLAAYFEAMDQLASFNTSSVSTSTAQAGENAAFAGQLNLTQADSIGKLAGFVTEAFTAHYRTSHLLKYLREADPSISSALKGFQDIVGKDYEGLLAEEQRALTFRYRQVGDAANSATILLLNRAYSGDLDHLNRRKAAALAYVTALDQIRQGHRELAQNAGHLGSKQLNVAMQPYNAKLEALLPVLQKAF